MLQHACWLRPLPAVHTPPTPPHGHCVQVMLCARKDLLPPVVTSEGWAALSLGGRAEGGREGGEGKRQGWASGHGEECKAEAVLTTAEANLKLRAQLMAAQASVRCREAVCARASRGKLRGCVGGGEQRRLACRATQDRAVACSTADACLGTLCHSCATVV